MRIFSFYDMENIYKSFSKGLDDDDLESRIEMLSNFPFSVVIEGEFLEFDNLDKWINIHYSSKMFSFLYYGKTGYNFGFGEYFFKSNDAVEKVKDAIPNIYSTYINAYPSGKICKSNGYDEIVDLDLNNPNAIIF